MISDLTEHPAEPEDPTEPEDPSPGVGFVMCRAPQCAWMLAYPAGDPRKAYRRRALHEQFCAYLS